MRVCGQVLATLISDLPTIQARQVCLKMQTSCSVYSQISHQIRRVLSKVGALVFKAKARPKKVAAQLKFNSRLVSTTIFNK